MTPKREVFSAGGRDYEIVNIPGDGNCLFLSASHFLKGSIHEAAGKVIRNETVDYVCNNWENQFEDQTIADLRNAGIMTKEQYKAYMGRAGVYGGEVELSAISQMRNVKITVFFKNEPLRPPWIFNEDGEHNITLLYSFQVLDNGHYEVLIPYQPHESAASNQAHRFEFATTNDEVCKKTFSSQGQHQVHSNIHSSVKLSEFFTEQSSDWDVQLL
jgi:hypothetical protein